MLVCSIQRLLGKGFNIEELITKENNYNVTIEAALFDTIRDISVLQQNLMFDYKTQEEKNSSSYKSNYIVYYFLLNKEST